jgi:hypothetical protein
MEEIFVKYVMKVVYQLAIHEHVKAAAAGAAAAAIEIELWDTMALFADKAHMNCFEPATTAAAVAASSDKFFLPYVASALCVYTSVPNVATLVAPLLAAARAQPLDLQKEYQKWRATKLVELSTKTAPKLIDSVVQMLHRKLQYALDATLYGPPTAQHGDVFVKNDAVIQFSRRGAPAGTGAGGGGAPRPPGGGGVGAGAPAGGAPGVGPPAPLVVNPAVAAAVTEARNSAAAARRDYEEVNSSVARTPTFLGTFGGCAAAFAALKNDFEKAALSSSAVDSAAVRDDVATAQSAADDALKSSQLANKRREAIESTLTAYLDLKSAKEYKDYLNNTYIPVIEPLITPGQMAGPERVISEQNPILITAEGQLARADRHCQTAADATAYNDVYRASRDAQKASLRSRRNAGTVSGALDGVKDGLKAIATVVADAFETSSRSSITPATADEYARNAAVVADRALDDYNKAKTAVDHLRTEVPTSRVLGDATPTLESCRDGAVLVRKAADDARKYADSASSASEGKEYVHGLNQQAFAASKRASAEAEFVKDAMIIVITAVNTGLTYAGKSELTLGGRNKRTLADDYDASSASSSPDESESDARSDSGSESDADDMMAGGVISHALGEGDIALQPAELGGVLSAYRATRKKNLRSRRDFNTAFEKEILRVFKGKDCHAVLAKLRRARVVR